MHASIAPEDLNTIMAERRAGGMDTQAVTFDSETGAPHQQTAFSLKQEFTSAAPDTSVATPQVGFVLPGMN